jgi:hypothetical protein
VLLRGRDLRAISQLPTGCAPNGWLAVLKLL